ncbi:3-mercaptopyruvate sulfurtransferase [Thalassospira sp.]|uniref:3-mercaptopyruvate sulfurtransferase n=1 Tax=Thalassospira sp. TaxID=1912094 RepID=UPI0027361F9B|nr:3-mercaptopyruvate sulfurtransferase [Thalassospira sp.]MDP2698196.1 3-mercaptopyruvate sulfurtransferase [Thalassospira sp.]
MTYSNPDALVSTQWLADHLDAPDIRVIDASWYMPGQDKDARTLYHAQHIPGAVFFDIDDIAADDSAPLPHMMPDAIKFSARVRKLGLGDGVRIVVYAQTGMASAACRAWWMLRHFGHNDVAVLDGGLPKWIADGNPVTDAPTPPRERHFTVRANSFLIREYDQVLANITTRREQLVDARSSARFNASAPEPWGDPGHIPGAQNLPFETLIASDGTFKPADDLRAAFDTAGIDLGKPVVASCGSGVTACVLAMGAYLIGKKEVAVYDGSWAEWASRPDSPRATGTAPS